MRVFKPIEGKRLSQTVVDHDGGRLARGAGRRARRAAGHGGAHASTEVLYAAAGPRDARAVAAFCADRGSPRRSPSRSGWDAASACARRASCRSRARTGAATTTCASCVDGPVFNPARVAVGPVAERRAARCCPRPPEGLPVVRRGRGETHARRRPRRGAASCRRPCMVAAGCAGTGPRAQRTRRPRRIGGRRVAEHHGARRSGARRPRGSPSRPPASCGPRGCRTRAWTRSWPRSCRGSRAAGRRRSSRSAAARWRSSCA